MRNRLLIVLIALSLTGCAMLEPHFSDSLDPFTSIRQRTMWVGTSTNYQALVQALYYPNPVKVAAAQIPINNYLSINIAGRDTLLTVIRFFPEKGYDVPADARLLIKFADKNDNGPILDLPLLKNYHTTGGSLVVRSRLSAQAVRLLQLEAIDYVRIERVSTNESDYTDVNWRTSTEYGKAFRRGSIILFAQPKERGRRK